MPNELNVLMTFKALILAHFNEWLLMPHGSPVEVSNQRTTNNLNSTPNEQLYALSKWEKSIKQCNLMKCLNKIKSGLKLNQNEH